MIKIKDKKKFIIFLIILVCFVFSGIYLFKKINDLKNSKSGKQLPEKSDLIYREGIKKLSEGDFESASKVLEKSLEGDSNNFEKLEKLAISQYNQQKYAEAEKNFKKLLEGGNDNNYVYYNNLANIYRDQKNYDKAVEYYKKSIEVNPKYETAYQNLAILYLYEMENSQPEKIQEIINQGLKNIPDSESLKRMQK